MDEPPSSATVAPAAIQTAMCAARCGTCDACLNHLVAVKVRRLEFARWLYRTGRLNDGQDGAAPTTDMPPNTKGQ